MAPISFLALPAELRNEIYELAFTTNTHSEDGKSIDLRNTSPASKALLLTCRQTYKEAAKVYTEAYRKYWNNSQFDLDLDTMAYGKQGREAMKAIGSEDFAHISHLHIRRTLQITRTTRIQRIRRDVHRVMHGWRYEEYIDDVLHLTEFWGFRFTTPREPEFRSYRREDVLAGKHSLDPRAVLELGWVELDELLDIVFW